MTKRKRGRPPRGQFSRLTAVTSLRMPEDLRQLLEEARKERSKRLNREIGFSQELLYRLQNSFNRERDEARDPAMRAFSFLFSELAQVIGANPELAPEWRFDPWLFQTFMLAVPKLLDRFRPAGKMKLPEFWQFIRETPDIEGLPATKEEREKITDSPEAMANHAVQKVLSDFNNPQQAKHLLEGWRGLEGRLAKPSHRRIAGDLTRKWEATYYGMTDAQRDLALKPKSKSGRPLKKGAAND
jgi:hypothetical protein